MNTEIRTIPLDITRNLHPREDGYLDPPKTLREVASWTRGALNPGEDAEGMKKVIIFDYDGVIVDSLELFCAAAIEVFRDVRLSQLANKESILAFHERNWFESMTAAGISPTTAAAVEDHVALLLEGNEHLVPFPGIAEAISALARKATLVIVTSSRERVVKEFLQRHGIEGFAETIGSDEETSKVTKIRLVRARYGDCDYWYVGDTVGDIMEGHAAGVRTLAVGWGWHDAERLLKAGPEGFARDIGELLGTLEA